MKFGKAIRGEWLLDEDVIFLNHGSFGACPRSVLEVQREWRERMEAEPVRFMIRELPLHLEAARAELANFVGSRAEDLLFVQNATDGANADIVKVHEGLFTWRGWSLSAPDWRAAPPPSMMAVPPLVLLMVTLWLSICKAPLAPLWELPKRVS